MFFATRRPTAAARRHRTNRRLSLVAVENLEGRQLLTGGLEVPQFATVDLSHNNWQYTQIPTTKFAAMEDTTVTGIMPATKVATGFAYGDNFDVYLTRGQIDDITLDVSSVYNNSKAIAHSDTSISVYDPNGNQVTGTATPDGDSEIDFQASMSGWYYVSMHTDASSGGTGATLTGTPTYTAQVQPIGLDTETDAQMNPSKSAGDAAKLTFGGGGLYAWMNGRNSTGANGAVSTTGTSVTFSGPTGRGFTIDGTWTEATNRTTWGITYTGSNLQLEMADPSNPGGTLKIPLSIGGATGLQVTMAPQTANDAQGLFGQVLGTKFTVGDIPFASQSGSNASIASVMSTVAGDFGETADLSKYGASVTAANNLNWGIDLGDIASAQTGNLPANQAVPYLWFSADAGDQVGATFGNIQVSAGTGVGFAALLDPADPSFCLHVTGLSYVPDEGVGGSMNGLIPFNPISSTIKGQTLGGSPLFGDVFVRGALDLGALTDETVPVTLAGDVTLNLDPNHYGFATIASNLKSDFANLLTKQPTSMTGINQLKSDVAQVSLGVNGTASLSFNVKAINIQVPVASASVEWNGITGDFSFAGGTVNPLAGTPAAFLTANSSLYAAGDVNTRSGAFNVDVDGNYGMLGQTLANADVNLSGNWNNTITCTVTGTSDVQIGVGSANTVGIWADANDNVTISMDSNGNGSLSVGGSASASAAFAGWQAAGTGYNYSYSNQGNIVALLTAEYEDIKRTIGADANNLLIDLENDYYQALNKVKAAWSSVENWFSSL